MSMMTALNDYNQAPLDAWSQAFLEAELELRTAMKKMADLTTATIKFQKDVILPPGYYGYVLYPYQRAVEVDVDEPEEAGRWLGERTVKQVNHPSNFAESFGLIGVAVGTLGQAITDLKTAHTRAEYELCNFRIIAEGPGKNLGDVT